MGILEKKNVTICNIYNIKNVGTNYKKFGKNVKNMAFLLTNIENTDRITNVISVTNL